MLMEKGDQRDILEMRLVTWKGWSIRGSLVVIPAEVMELVLGG
jgi:hypothetical protein